MKDAIKSFEERINGNIQSMTDSARDLSQQLKGYLSAVDEFKKFLKEGLLEMASRGTAEVEKAREEGREEVRAKLQEKVNALEASTVEAEAAKKKGKKPTQAA